jgi:hypothetical protein
MKRFISALGAALIITGVGSPVSAHDSQTAFSPDGRDYIYLRHDGDGPTRVRQCDGHVDGHRVRAHLLVRYLYDVQVSPVWAPSQGCNFWYTNFHVHDIDAFRVCTEGEGCSGWLDNIFH